MIGPARFRFLNAVWSVESAHGWDDPARPRLWNYNLHYFDDLNGVGAEARSAWHEALIERWLRENPPPRGTAWEPYPASLRCVNIAKWLLRRPATFEPALEALGMSARAVSRQLEFHLFGNHLFANAKALWFAGLCSDGAESGDWLRSARMILEGEMPEQILSDGGHFELSPMYHAIVLEDVLDIVNLARAYGESVPAGIAQRIPSMLAWLAAMTHPDGEISHFNDAAPGIAATPAALAAYGRSLGFVLAPPSALESPERPAAIDLAASGYARLQDAPGSDCRAVVICDAAAAAPAYLPGHAHADTLSFEMSIGGRRVIVNAGTSTYAAGPERLSERGTAAHSTVQLAKADSSEVWDSFRCGARARVTGRSFSADGDSIQLTASHDGYRFLHGSWMHERTWRMTRGTLVIADRVWPRRRFGSASLSVVSRFLLHPSIEVHTGSAADEWHLLVGGSRLASFQPSPQAAWSIEPFRYAEGFGMPRASRAIVGQVGARAKLELECRIRFGAEE